MTATKNVPSKPKARQQLEQSTLRLDQRELLGDDIDISDLQAKLGSSSFDLLPAITTMPITRTIEGASTVEPAVLDQDRKLLRSGRLASKVDIAIDGLNFRLVA